MTTPISNKCTLTVDANNGLQRVKRLPNKSDYVGFPVTPKNCGLLNKPEIMPPSAINFWAQEKNADVKFVEPNQERFYK